MRALALVGLAILSAAILATALGTHSPRSRSGSVGSSSASDDESLGSEYDNLVPEWSNAQGFEGNPVAVAGAKVFAQLTCLNCHTYRGAGSSNFDAPDLSEEGVKGRGVDGLMAYSSNPGSFGDTVMPSFADIGDANLQRVAVFLDASRAQT
jgi:hypothetical protein